MLLLAFDDYAQQGALVAEQLDLPLQRVDVHRFPDGESRIRLPADMGGHVVLCRSLDRPNDKLVELILAAQGARELGADRITLVAPYLCYMRQDAAFAPGEVVSQQIIGRLLGEVCDALITVDPHLHRVHRLQDAVPVEHALSLTAAPAMGEFLKARQGDAPPLLIGPDSESHQWVASVAAAASLEFVIARKERHGDRDVDISLPPYAYAGREVVLVDDIASSGRTLAGAAHAAKAAGAASVDVLVTHGLFAADALEVIYGAGVAQVISSDSVSHPTNGFSLAPLIAEAVREVAAEPG